MSWVGHAGCNAVFCFERLHGCQCTGCRLSQLYLPCMALLQQDVETLLSKSVSDVYREAAALKEQQVALKLESGKLARAELLMKQKVQQCG